MTGGFTIMRRGKPVPGRFESKAEAEKAIRQLGWKDAVAVPL